MPETEVETAQEEPTNADASKKTQISMAIRSGLVFPPCRSYNHMKQRKVCPKISKTASVYMAAVLEYLASDLLEMAGDAAKAAKIKRITPRQITLAMFGDEEFSRFVKNRYVDGGGVTPHINKRLLKPKNARSSSSNQMEVDADATGAAPQEEEAEDEEGVDVIRTNDSESIQTQEAENTDTVVEKKKKKKKSSSKLV